MYVPRHNQKWDSEREGILEFFIRRILQPRVQLMEKSFEKCIQIAKIVNGSRIASGNQTETDFNRLRKNECG